MRLNFSFLFFLAAGCATASMSAQDLSDIPPPKPPLVAPVPNAADWTITAKPTSATPQLSPTAAKHEDPHAVEVHTTSTGSMRRDDITYSDGNKAEHWFVEFVLMSKTPDGEIAANDLRGAPPVEAEDPNPSVAQGFPGMRWVQLSYFDKVVAVEKHPCYHYVHGETEAWINTDTKLPVAYKSKTTAYLYKFSDPPTEALKLPPDYQKAWDKVQQLLTRMQRLARPPMANR